MSRSMRIVGILIAEGLRLTECLLIISCAVYGLYVQSRGHILIGWMIFGMALGLIAVAKLVNVKSGIDEFLDECWEPVNRWIERSFLWLPGAR